MQIYFCNENNDAIKSRMTMSINEHGSGSLGLHPITKVLNKYPCTDRGRYVVMVAIMVSYTENIASKIWSQNKCVY